MEWYELASKQTPVNRHLHIYDPISLLAFSKCQWPGKAGLQNLSLCATVIILSYAGCGPGSPDDEARPKPNCKYDSVEWPVLKFLHNKLTTTREGRECVTTRAT